jgi:hypothetical protein
MWENVNFTLEITVENPGDGFGDDVDVLVEDGIGAELDLILQHEEGIYTQIKNTTTDPDGPWEDKYGIGTGSFTVSWNHTIDSPLIGIMSATLEIWHLDVDSGEYDTVYVDGVNEGLLTQGSGSMELNNTIVTMSTLSDLDDGIIYVDVDVDPTYYVWIYNSTLTVEYSYDYIFKVDGNPVLLDSGDIFYGSSGDVEWWQASDKAYQKMLAGKNKGCATKINWDIEDLADNSSTTLWFEVETKEWYTGNGKWLKQSYTSTCHHELNSGPEAYYDVDDDGVIDGMVKGDPVIVSVYDPTPGVDTDGDGIEDIDEVEVYLTDPCDPEVHPIFVSGFNSSRNRAPLGSSGSDDLKDELLDTGNFGYGGTVPSPVVFLDFVSTIASESLVDGDGDLLCHVFFAGLTGTDLTTAEADELKAFLEAGGILYISGNSGANEGPSYNPLFTTLGWSDSYTATVTGSNYVPTSTPVSTPVTSGGPFGSVGPLTHTLFRIISTSSAINVSNGYLTTDCIIAEATVGSNGGYLSMMGDPLYFDIFIGNPSNDPDNLNYFLNLFALAS